MQALINTLASRTGQFLLVFDDYHLITEPEVHRSLTYFVEHLPPQLHIILATRADQGSTPYLDTVLAAFATTSPHNGKTRLAGESGHPLRYGPMSTFLEPLSERELEVLRLQSDIKRQGHLVTMAINPLVEALNDGGNVSLEMMNHIKAQILLAHLQLDELEQLLGAID